MWSLIESVLGSAYQKGRHKPFSVEVRSVTNAHDATTSRAVRFWCDGEVYLIAAYLNEQVSVPMESFTATVRPQLYIKTRCRAIAQYCLFGHKDGDFEVLPDFYLSSPEHQLICLRLRRCGAVRLEPSTWNDPLIDCSLADDQLRAYFLGTSSCIFGWPRPQPTTGQEDGAKQPVWAYRIPPRHTQLGPDDEGYGDVQVTDNDREEDDLERLKKDVFMDGVEAVSGLHDLIDCRTMDEYCEQLQAWGATFYDDVAECPEANRLGLV